MDDNKPTQPRLFELYEDAIQTPHHILPARSRNLDFFVADLLDWAPKDDLHSMEHPFFSLSKTPDLKVREYERNGIRVRIVPGVTGAATIWDKDILLYAVSQLVAAVNRDAPVSRVVHLKAYDLLRATGRGTDGRGYEQLKDAFERLAGTRVRTNLVAGGRRAIKGFGIIDSWAVLEKSPTDNTMVSIELTLSDWLFGAVLEREVLTLNRDYFGLDSGLERRLYQLARKHCGRQEVSPPMGLQALYEKSGSRAKLFEFRRMVKRAVARDALPDYHLTYDQDKDQVEFRRR